MTPTQPTQPNIGVVIERLDTVSRQLDDLADKIECLTKEQTSFMVQYTKSHTELEARVFRVNEKADDAHKRIDKLAAGAWGLTLPILLGALAFIWGVLTHTIVIGP